MPAFLKAFQTLKDWRGEILNSIIFFYSNGYLEGLYNKTKAIKGNTYDFLCFKHFKVKHLLNIQYKEIKVHLC